MSMFQREQVATVRLPDFWLTAAGDRVELFASGHYPHRRWYWRIRAAGNGEAIATGGEGYTRRRSARRAAERLHPPISPEVSRG